VMSASGVPSHEESGEIKKCSTRLSNQTVLQTRMRSRKIAIARHCRRGPACAYRAIRDGLGASAPPRQISRVGWALSDSLVAVDALRSSEARGAPRGLPQPALARRAVRQRKANGTAFDGTAARQLNCESVFRGVLSYGRGRNNARAAAVLDPCRGESFA
jgi:hypothetical protein